MYSLLVSRSDSHSRRRAAKPRMADSVCLRTKPAQLFSDIFGELQPVIPLDGVALVLPDASQNKLTIELWNGSRCLRGLLRVSTDRSMTASVWRDQTTLRIDDLANKNLTRERQNKTEPRHLGELQMCCDIHTQRSSKKNPS
jgi:hypothetical protein